MTAVDDLREAAKLLRERVDALSPTVRSQPWRAVHLDETIDGVAACDDPAWMHADDEGCTHCYYLDTRVPAVAAYIASMHPLVGLALAEMLEWFAERWIDDKAVIHYAARAEIQGRAQSLARLYLGRSS